MPTQFPVTQGFIPSFQSSEIDLMGRRFFGIKSVNWEESCEGEIEYGNGPLPIGVTVGQYTASVEFEQLVVEYNRLIAALGNSFGTKFWNAGFQFVEPGTPIITVDFTNIRLFNNSASLSGKAGSTIKYKCQVFQPIKINGLSMIDRFVSGQNFSIGAAVNQVDGGLASFGAALAA